MKSLQYNNTLRRYKSPILSIINVDNQISLALESEPPIGPGDEYSLLQPSPANNNPFVSNKLS